MVKRSSFTVLRTVRVGILIKTKSKDKGKRTGVSVPHEQGVAEVEILRLSNCFASRSSYSAQDDNVVRSRIRVPYFSGPRGARNGGLRNSGRAAQFYWPAGFSAGLAEGFLVSAIAALGFQKSGSALIQSSEA